MAREGGMLWGKLPEIIHPGPYLLCGRCRSSEVIMSGIVCLSISFLSFFSVPVFCYIFAAKNIEYVITMWYSRFAECG